MGMTKHPHNPIFEICWPARAFRSTSRVHYSRARSHTYQTQYKFIRTCMQIVESLTLSHSFVPALFVSISAIGWLCFGFFVHMLLFEYFLIFYFSWLSSLDTIQTHATLDESEYISHSSSLSLALERNRAPQQQVISCVFFFILIVA